MVERTSYGVVLTEEEAEALARRLMARIASDWFKLVEWEVVPELWEGSWEVVAVRLDNLAQQAHDAADRSDGATGIDSRYLFEVATYPPQAADREASDARNARVMPDRPLTGER